MRAILTDKFQTIETAISIFHLATFYTPNDQALNDFNRQLPHF